MYKAEGSSGEKDSHSSRSAARQERQPLIVYKKQIIFGAVRRLIGQTGRC